MNTTTHKDPVCGMEIEESKATGKADHEGTTYYFCSSSCQKKFEENPSDYAK